MEPTLGFEPRTCCLRNSCSTAELCRRRSRIADAQRHQLFVLVHAHSASCSGPWDNARTADNCQDGPPGSSRRRERSFDIGHRSPVHRRRARGPIRGTGASAPRCRCRWVRPAVRRRGGSGRRSGTGSRVRKSSTILFTRSGFSCVRKVGGVGTAASSAFGIAAYMSITSCIVTRSSSANITSVRAWTRPVRTPSGRCDLVRPHLSFRISHRVAARQSASRGWRQRSPALPYPEGWPTVPVWIVPARARPSRGTSPREPVPD